MKFIVEISIVDWNLEKALREETLFFSNYDNLLSWADKEKILPELNFDNYEKEDILEWEIGNWNEYQATIYNIDYCYRLYRVGEDITENDNFEKVLKNLW